MEEIIKFIGGSAVLLGAVAWLIKSIVFHFLSKDVETYKNRLQHEGSLELEKLRHELRIGGLEYEAKIAALHTKRAEVVSELYRLLIEFIGDAESFTNQMEFHGEPSKDEKLELLIKSGTSFRKYFVTHRIYFSENICKATDSLWEEAFGSTRKYNFWRVRENTSSQGFEKSEEAWDAAWESMTKKVPELLRGVENEFRELLGVLEQEPKKVITRPLVS